MGRKPAMGDRKQGLESRGPLSDRRKPVIGLCGGIGAGKSEVGRILTDHAVAVISSDRLVRDELGAPETVATLRSWYGPSILDDSGAIRRNKLADIVFADEAERARVEGLLHPLVESRRRAIMRVHQGDAEVFAIAIDSPLLFEAGIDRECDVVWFVDAPLESRVARVTSGRGWTPDELSRREKIQKPLDFKKDRADHIIENRSGLDELRKRVENTLSQVFLKDPKRSASNHSPASNGVDKQDSDSQNGDSSG